MARDLRREQDEAVRITTAASSRDVDIAARQKRYLLSMTLRSLCFVGAIVAALAHVAWLWPILIAGALVLPYIAVVMANAASTKSDGFALLDSQYGQQELPTGTEAEGDTGPDRR
jgi:hypothetical protein